MWLKSCGTLFLPNHPKCDVIMDASQKTLAEAWLQAPRSGTLSAREQAKAWALREVWRAAKKDPHAATSPRGKGGRPNHSDRATGRARVKKGSKLKPKMKSAKRYKDYGMIEFVRVRVMTSGPEADHPSNGSLRTLFGKIDGDAEWYPGKKNPEACHPGPQPILKGPKRTAIASAAMALKRRGEEPTYSSIIAQCPQAAVLKARA